MRYRARCDLHFSMYITSRAKLAVAVLAAGLILACAEPAPNASIEAGAEGSTGADAGTPFEYEVPSCDAPLPGLDLAGRPEGEGDFASELSQLATLAEGAPERFETESLAPFFREVVAYLLMVPVSELGSIHIDTLVEGPPLSQGVALAFLLGDGRRPDINILRRALHRYYFCERELPLFLQDVRHLAGEMDPSHDILVENSRPKAHHRRLTANLAETFYFAETMVDDEVRETEVLWRSGRPDGALDFLVYNAEGVLQDGSYFVTSQGPETAEASPYACMACHRDRLDGSGFTVTIP